MTYVHQNVFVAGASDVSDESRLAISVVRRVSDIIDEPMQVFLKPYSWQQEKPLGPMEVRPQEIFNRRLRDSHVLILIIGERYGQGNTEEEANLAVDLAKKSLEKKNAAIPQILAFFRKLHPIEDVGPERQKVVELRRRLIEDAKVFPCVYGSLDEFRDELTHALYRNIIRFRHSTFKHRCLSSFWRTGRAEGKDSMVAIVYPAADTPINPAMYWHERLLPHVVFEDFKAMQKIEKTLRLIGVRPFRFYNVTDTPEDLMHHNKVWLCLPRNQEAQNALIAHSDECFFEIHAGRGKKCAHIRWGAPNAETHTIIESPLAQYLEMQRPCNDKNAPCSWTRNHRDIVGRDYAVLARFPYRSNFPTPDGPLWEYFIAGIRGLGTWGTGWFIDRRYDHFHDIDPEDNIQMLLEVTYKNGRIKDVINVSGKEQEYFTKENDPDTIEKRIMELGKNRM